MSASACCCSTRRCRTRSRPSVVTLPISRRGCTEMHGDPHRCRRAQHRSCRILLSHFLSEKPASTPDRVRGRLFPENAPFSFAAAEGWLRNSRIAASAGGRQFAGMPDTTFFFIAAVCALAGFIKGAVGLGLPTIAMGLLALVMPPVEAAAILILPSLVTNVWQMVAGPFLAEVVRRLWPMMLAICLGTWAGIGFMTGPQARYGAVLLGVCLAIYALLNLAVVRFAIARSREPLLGPISGALTGAITAATGIFAIPAVPYLQAIGLEQEDL